MIFLIDPIFITIYLCVLYLFNKLDINESNYLKHKFKIFLYIYVFALMMQFSKKITTTCRQNIFAYSFKTALIGIVAYSIFVDLHYISPFSKLFDTQNNIMKILLLLIIMVITFIILRYIDSLIMGNRLLCL